MLNSNLNSSNNNLVTNQNNQINSLINNALLNINTLFPAIIVSIDGLTCTIRTIINVLTINQKTPDPMVIENVPIAQIKGGNAGIIVPYKINDIVMCGAMQRDISSFKDNDWQQGNPASARKFNIGDAIVLFNLSNSTPTTFVEITDDVINITTSGSQSVNINTTGAVNVNSGTVNLGNGASLGVLLGNSPITATISGVQPGSGVAGVTFTATAGASNTVKATI